MFRTNLNKKFQEVFRKAEGTSYTTKKKGIACTYELEEKDDRYIFSLVISGKFTLAEQRVLTKKVNILAGRNEFSVMTIPGAVYTVMIEKVFDCEDAFADVVAEADAFVKIMQK